MHWGRNNIFRIIEHQKLKIIFTHIRVHFNKDGTDDIDITTRI